VQENVDELSSLPSKPLIISGGMTEVTADIDWINKFKTFILETIKKNQEAEIIQPVFGICFGAQLIVEAYSPGSVRYLDDPEIGVSKISLDIPSHHLFEGILKQFDAYSFHYNQIWSDDITVISDHLHKGHTFIQAFEIPNSHAYGVQFHPEFSYDEMRTLFRMYSNLIKELGFDIDPIINTLPPLSGNDRILLNFFSKTQTIE
jgi:GMP synthase-like glutamine amidotransferase